MAVLEQLEPKNVFQIFEELSSVPRGTFYDEKISNLVCGLCKKSESGIHTDDAGNVIIKSREHLDMKIRSRSFCRTYGYGLRESGGLRSRF